MTSFALVAKLETRGVSLRVDGGRLVANAPRDSLTAEDREDLARLKPELIALVSRPDDHWRWRVASWPQARWAEWRALATAILAALPADGRDEAGRVRVSDFAAYLETSDEAEYRVELERGADWPAETRAECWRHAKVLTAGGMSERQAEHVAVATVVESHRRPQDDA